MSLTSPAQKKYSIPTQSITASYFSLEELIHYAENPSYLYERLLLGIQVIINEYLDLLRKNNVRINSEPGDEPYMILKKTILTLHHEKEVLLTIQEIPAEQKQALRNVVPFPESHSIEDLIALGQELNAFGIINPSHCTVYQEDTYLAYQKIKSLTDLPLIDVSKITDLKPKDVNRLNEGLYFLLFHLIKIDASTVQKTTLLSKYLNQNKITALGDWNQADILNGRAYGYGEHMGNLGRIVNLLFKVLPSTNVTHLDLHLDRLVKLNDEGMVDLISILPNSNITHLKLGNLDSCQVSILSSILSKTKLQSLTIRFTFLSIIESNMLIETLPFCKQLTHLDLTGCQIEAYSDRFREIILGFTRSSLKHINLTGIFSNGLYKEIPLHILEYLAKCIPGSCIETLTAKGSENYDNYQKLIIPALRKNAKIHNKSSNHALLEPQHSSSSSPSSSVLLTAALSEPLTFSAHASHVTKGPKKPNSQTITEDKNTRNKNKIW